MKAITEAVIRAELKAERPEVYYIPEGTILTPAAREYLNQLQIPVDLEKNRIQEEKKQEEEAAQKQVEAPRKKYVDEETGAFYEEKPEHMTQLYANVLVDKNHPRIKYRGKLDTLQADVVYTQAVVARLEENKGLLEDLNDVLGILRELMRCEVLNEEFSNEMIIGLNHKELREHSHNPQKFYNIKSMLLPDYSMGEVYALLNKIRTGIRETELAAVDAFKTNRKMERTDIIEELNRLSSALHIMMCKYLGGAYQVKQ